MKAFSLIFGAALLLPACGTGSSLPDPIDTPSPPPRLLPGMKRFRGVDHPQASFPTCMNPKLAYFGGPLLQSPTIIAVFWSSAVNPMVQANMAQFYADVTQTTYWRMLQEYDSVGLTPGSNQVILPGTSGGSVVISPSKCNPGADPCPLTDADLQAELSRQIDMNVLPPPSVDCTGNANTIYMVSFPPNITLTGPTTGVSCANMGFCAYHSTGTYAPSGVPIIYGALMDEFTGPCSSGCGGASSPLDNTTSTASHELAEATTDADVGLVTALGYAYPAAWGDNDNGCGEIGDICDTHGSTATITVSGRSWVVQQLWSNKQNACVSSGPGQPICAGTTLADCRMCSCGDNGGVCNGVTPVCEASSANVLWGACEACTATAGTCSQGSCLQSTTPSQDDICPGCVPLTACPAGANCGPLPDGCGGTLNCGTCTAPQTCGGGTPFVANVCGCTPATDCGPAVKCGTAPDGCGGMVLCGTCTPPETCGGGIPSFPGVCGCTPINACPAGDDCGEVPDGCNGMIACGGCGPDQTCVKNQCVASSSSSSSTSSSSSASSSASSSSSTTASSSSSGGTGGSGTGGAAASSSSGHGESPAPSGGCHCEVAGAPPGPTSSRLWVLGLLALAVMPRRRSLGNSRRGLGNPYWVPHRYQQTRLLP